LHKKSLKFEELLQVDGAAVCRGGHNRPQQAHTATQSHLPGKISSTHHPDQSTSIPSIPTTNPARIIKEIFAIQTKKSRKNLHKSLIMLTFTPLLTARSFKS
jgi:hypothetical protein